MFSHLFDEDPAAMSFILVELGYSLVCSPIVCYLKERMANGDVAFYCNRHHCVD